MLHVDSGYNETGPTAAYLIGSSFGANITDDDEIFLTHTEGIRDKQLWHPFPLGNVLTA